LYKLQLTPEQYLSLLVERGYARALPIRGPVDHLSLALLIVTVALPEQHGGYRPPSPCVRATSDPSLSVRAVSSSVASVTGRLQTSPSGRRISSTTLSYSSRSIKPSRGLKTPVEIICRSETVREPRVTFGSSATSLRRSSRSSAGTVRSASCPPWGAMDSSFFR